jgi:hypothetical protein
MVLRRPRSIHVSIANSVGDIDCVTQRSRQISELVSGMQKALILIVHENSSPLRGPPKESTSVTHDKVTKYVHTFVGVPINSSEITLRADKQFTASILIQTLRE